METSLTSLSSKISRYEERLAKDVQTEVTRRRDCTGGPAKLSMRSQLPSHAIQSVVKIYCTTSPINYMLPWQRKQQGSSTGSGFVLDAKQHLLITNAHVVSSASFIEVRRHGDSVRYSAEVRFISADCDLAILSVNDPDFWQGAREFDFAGVPHKSGQTAMSAIQRIASVGYVGGLPKLQQSVTVVGYPYGGDQVSITQGVVSRIDSSPYGGIDVHLMAIQIDAAINPGNSGGPSICNGKVVGIAFQALVHGDNIGYIIPVPIIAHFLRCFLKQNNHTSRYTPGHYHDGFSSIGSFLQELHNDSLRQKLSIPKETSGILLLDVRPTSSAAGKLLPNDVITKIDEHVMGNDATMKLRGERLRFSHYLQMKSPGQNVLMHIIRNGKPKRISVPLSINRPLVPNHLFTKEHCERPRYILYCGCIFAQLTLPLLLEWGVSDWIHNAPRHLTNFVLGGDRTHERDEIVVLLQMFPHKVNQGYASEHFVHRVVTTVNKTPVKNMAHLKELLNGPQASAFVHIRLQNVVNELSLVLPARERQEVDDTIRQLYNIPVQP